MANLKPVKKKDRVGNVLPGQHWIELHGTFHPMELRAITDRLEDGIKKIKQNGRKK